MTKRAYRVSGPRPVAGVGTGGTVHLDPEAVNIPALIEAGHIEIVRKPSVKESAPEKTAEEVAA
ncbi:hypothetical protein [Nonomuraea wenchangensis]|uniref:Uncharacterized protein n=1 Tax=Nonomuraea wenchangensis TaxID=568860 RepID=A0A1I0EF32_9ACTN|nr:hypothetical protein [Nonomuraea wenchangensis]SET43435.1 hypothetical protein SAMN05421811_10311 [Nonomuraea wenchangensis]